MFEQDEHCEDTFRMTLGNVPIGGKVKILLKYVSFLEAENLELQSTSESGSQITFTLPTVMNPRYSPEGECTYYFSI